MREENRTIAFVQEAAHGLPGSIKDVADYLLSEGTGIVNLTMAQIAARTYVSKPTLVRFAKMAGYPGWTAFRHDFLVAIESVEQERVRQANVDVNHPLSAGTTAQDALTRLARIHELAAQEVRRSVSPDELEGAAHALLDAHVVAIVGAMQNQDRAEVLASNLGLMGILCHVYRGSRASAISSCLAEGDAVVAISYSGELKHGPMRSIPNLREQGIRIVAITNAESSALAAVADHALRFPRLERYHDKVGAFYSGACTSLILDALYAACLALSYEKGMAKRTHVLTSIDGRIPQEFVGTSDQG